jgi:hypothetical protein
MTMKIGIFAAAVALTASAAVAAPQDDAAEQAATAAPAQQASTAAAEDEAEPQEEKKICRTERATGSLTRRTRVCMTAAQWREINAKTYRGVTEMQGSASGSQAIVNNPGAGGPGG